MRRSNATHRAHDMMNLFQIAQPGQTALRHTFDLVAADDFTLIDVGAQLAIEAAACPADLPGDDAMPGKCLIRCRQAKALHGGFQRLTGNDGARMFAGALHHGSGAPGKRDGSKDDQSHGYSFLKKSGKRGMIRRSMQGGNQQ